MEIVTLVLALASLILHFVAPKTKTTVDDKAADVVDTVKDAIDAPK